VTSLRPHEIEAIDRATMALYEQVRTSPRHAPLIRRIEAPSTVRDFEVTPAPCIVVMPGAFHEHHAHTGADGRRVLELAAELGWPAETVPVPSLGFMAANAETLAGFLAGRRRRGEPAVLVSLSKGGSDVRAALARPDLAAQLRDVRAWVNISGIVTGTPLVAWLRARPLRCLGVRMLLACRGQPWAAIDELRSGPGAPLATPMTLPPGMRVIHVVGFPRVADLSNDWARRGHARLAPLGPNDGGGIMLRDVIDLPGEVYPVRHADHYLAPPWDIRPLLLRVLEDAAARSAPCPPVGEQREGDAGDDVDGVVLLGRERRIQNESRPRDAR
jgi:hypothetical protein